MQFEYQAESLSRDLHLTYKSKAARADCPGGFVIY